MGKKNLYLKRKANLHPCYEEVVIPYLTFFIYVFILSKWTKQKTKTSPESIYFSDFIAFYTIFRSSLVWFPSCFPLSKLYWLIEIKVYSSNSFSLIYFLPFWIWFISLFFFFLYNFHSKNLTLFKSNHSPGTLVSQRTYYWICCWKQINNKSVRIMEL